MRWMHSLCRGLQKYFLRYVQDIAIEGHGKSLGVRVGAISGSGLGFALLLE